MRHDIYGRKDGKLGTIVCSEILLKEDENGDDFCIQGSLCKGQGRDDCLVEIYNRRKEDKDMYWEQVY